MAKVKPVGHIDFNLPSQIAHFVPICRDSGIAAIEYIDDLRVYYSIRSIDGHKRYINAYILENIIVDDMALLEEIHSHLRAKKCNLRTYDRYLESLHSMVESEQPKLSQLIDIIKACKYINGISMEKLA